MTIKDNMNSMWITQSIIWHFLKTKDSFTLNELKNEIKKRGGIWRVDYAYTVDEYLKFLEYIGAIEQDLQKKYIIKKQKGNK